MFQNAFVCIVPVDMLNSATTKLKAGIYVRSIGLCLPQGMAKFLPLEVLKLRLNDRLSQLGHSPSSGKKKKDHIKFSVLLAVDNDLSGEVIFYIGHI